MTEGIQKFLFPDALGVGRFTKIGIPAPEIMAPFVGVCETDADVLFLLSLLTRFAAITMIIDHAGRHRNHEGSHSAPRRILEDGSRGPHRLGHAAWFDLPPRRRGRALVD